MKWYYVAGGDRLGPFEDAEFLKLADDATITDSTLVWNKSMENWQPYETIAAVEDNVPDIIETPAGEMSESSAPTYPCSECGNSFPEDELIRFENSNVCAKCKPAFVQKIREGVAVSSVIYAGFWIRVGAKIIDGLVLLVVNSVMGLLVGALSYSSQDPSEMVATNLALSGLQMCVAAGYSCWFLGKFSATPGKMVCGLTVITGDHNKVSYLQGFGRYFGEILSSIILGIGYIMVAFDSEKRGLHDRVCNTRVVYKKSLN